jgi:cytochrome c1
MMSARRPVCAAIAVLAACTHGGRYEPVIPDADLTRGRRAIAELECGACHVVPGVPGAWGRVGPTLAGFKSSVYIAGQHPNVPDVLVRFIRDAPSLAPDTAMPAIEMSDRQARDIAAYLYSLE